MLLLVKRIYQCATTGRLQTPHGLLINTPVSSNITPIAIGDTCKVCYVIVSQGTHVCLGSIMIIIL